MRYCKADTSDYLIGVKAQLKGKSTIVCCGMIREMFYHIETPPIGMAFHLLTDGSSSSIGWDIDQYYPQELDLQTCCGDSLDEPDFISLLLDQLLVYAINKGIKFIHGNFHKSELSANFVEALEAYDFILTKKEEDSQILGVELWIDKDYQQIN